MSKARAQSSKRKMMRTLYGSQNPSPNSSKRTGMKLQVINLFPPKKKGRRSIKAIERGKWLERLPLHLGSSKYIYHQQVIKAVEEEEKEKTTEDISKLTNKT